MNPVASWKFRVTFGGWAWAVFNPQTDTYLAEGHTWTKRGADRKIAEALAR